MSLNYTTYVSQTTNLMSVASSTDPSFTIFLPGAIDYAEGRCYRDLDLYATRITDVSATCSSGVRTFTLPTVQGTFQVVERVNILSSAGALSSNATRNPTFVVSPDVMDAVYPTAVSSYNGVPQWVARITDTTLIFGPVPDAAYTVEVYGTIRPTPLSVANSSTWLTQWVPELFMAATMIFATGYMRDFGQQSDDPRGSQSWEQQYTTLLKSANTDELRKKYQSVAWSNQQPSPIASPPRV